MNTNLIVCSLLARRSLSPAFVIDRLVISWSLNRHQLVTRSPSAGHSMVIAAGQLAEENLIRERWIR